MGLIMTGFVFAVFMRFVHFLMLWRYLQHIALNQANNVKIFNNNSA